jgi:hypothetical protein
MDANAIGFADVLPIFWRSRLRSGYSGRRLPPFADRSARYAPRERDYQRAHSSSARDRPRSRRCRRVKSQTHASSERSD